MFTQISKLIPETLRNKGIYSGVEAAQILIRAKEFYTSVLPKIHTEPLMFKKGILYIEVESSGVAHECHMYGEACIETLSLEGYDVKEIKFRIQ